MGERHEAGARRGRVALKGAEGQALWGRGLRRGAGHGRKVTGWPDGLEGGPGRSAGDRRPNVPTSQPPGPDPGWPEGGPGGRWLVADSVPTGAPVGTWVGTRSGSQIRLYVPTVPTVPTKRDKRRTRNAARGGPPRNDNRSSSGGSRRAGWDRWDVEPNLAARPRPNAPQGLGRS